MIIITTINIIIIPTIINIGTPYFLIISLNLRFIKYILLYKILMKGQLTMEYLTMLSVIVSLSFIAFLVLMGLAGLANYMTAKIADLSVTLFVSILCS